jgi:hypothetical protein
MLPEAITVAHYQLAQISCRLATFRLDNPHPVELISPKLIQPSHEEGR